MGSLNYNHLLYFHVIASEGSLKKAAKVLHVTQPTLSEQLGQLETFLKAPLFERKPTGLVLNARGRTALRYTSIIFKTGERLVQSFHQRLSVTSRLLEIGVLSTVSKSLATEIFIPVFESPNFLARIRSGENEHLRHDLLTGEIDILISDEKTLYPKSKGIKSIVIQNPRYLIVCGKKLHTKVDPKDLSSLNNIPFINYSNSSSVKWEIDNFFGLSGIRPPVLGEVDDISIMRLTTEKDLCFSILPEQVVKEAISEKRLFAIAEIPSLRVQISAHYRSTTSSDVAKEAIRLLSTHKKNEN